MVARHSQNPIITISDIKPSRPDFEILGVFNAGTATYKGERILLVRVAEKPVQSDPQKVPVPIFNPIRKKTEILFLDQNDSSYDFSDPRVIHCKQGQNYLTSISHIRYAESEDGIHFRVADEPLIAAFDEYTAFGVEDARITQMGDDYYVNFSAASEYGIVTRLLRTKDFASFQDLGNIFHPDNKDVTIFPEKINGLYYALHRPSTSEYGVPNLWIADSPDLVHWGNNRVAATVRPNQWDNGRIGASCVPFLTEKGWLEIYHGATKENRYCLGAMLLKADEPWKVLARSERPVLEPEMPYELNGFFGNVVFSCGLLANGRQLDIYYGASDDSVCLASVPVQEIWDLLGV